MLNHLLDIKSLDAGYIEKIVHLVQSFKDGALVADLSHKAVCLLFCENSTRTKLSFEMAAKNLGMKVLNFECSTSSFSKGESLATTVDNLAAMGVNALVMRDRTNGIQAELASKNPKLCVINAGDGNHSHPTQALLDYYTMLEKMGTVEGKKITIVGDIAHSRVARSNIELLSKFGADIHICAPSYFSIEDERVTTHSNLVTAIENADVVMCLRIQRERLENDFSLPVEDYIKGYQVTSKKLKEYAKENVLLMHPGPVNPGYEMSEELFNSPKAKTILEQVTNGVYVRMAILYLLLGKGEE